MPSGPPASPPAVWGGVSPPPARSAGGTPAQTAGGTPAVRLLVVFLAPALVAWRYTSELLAFTPP
ncbi:MAG TPA: hypothetical protein VEO54_01585 [Thermoanaerobaculia bacterium]|nr:hypothetical protein [Thermoanaerobaculia bacterium]